VNRGPPRQPATGEIRSARWQVGDGADDTRLHVTLWNDCSLTIVVPRDGPVRVRLWSNDGDLDLDRTSREAFRECLDRARGRE